MSGTTTATRANAATIRSTTWYVEVAADALGESVTDTMMLPVRRAAYFSEISDTRRMDWRQEPRG